MVTVKRAELITAGKTSISITVKISSDMGMNLSDFDSAFESRYSHPFFINCYNGDVLLGVTTVSTNSSNSKAIFIGAITMEKLL